MVKKSKTIIYFKPNKRAKTKKRRRVIISDSDWIAIQTDTRVLCILYSEQTLSFSKLQYLKSVLMRKWSSRDDTILVATENLA